MWCKASVKQYGDVFVEGLHNHMHEGDVNAGTVLYIKAEVKSKALGDIFSSAEEIADKMLVDSVDDQPLQLLPTVMNLARAANRLRQKLRPEDPNDMHFTLDEGFLPHDFLRKDISGPDYRMIIFATTKM
jgi:hypothetical protein